MHAQTPQHLGQSPHRNRRLLQPAKHRRLGKSLRRHTPLTLDEARFSTQGLRLWAKEVTQTLADLCYLVHSSSFFPSPNTELCWFHDVRWNCSLSSFLKLMCMGSFENPSILEAAPRHNADRRIAQVQGLHVHDAHSVASCS